MVEPETQAGRRAGTRGKVHTYTVSLYTDQIRTLSTTAHQRDRSVSDCVREAVDDWLKRQVGET